MLEIAILLLFWQYNVNKYHRRSSFWSINAVRFIHRLFCGVGVLYFMIGINDALKTHSNWYINVASKSS